MNSGIKVTNIKNNHRWFILTIGVLAQAIFSLAYAGIPITGVLMRSDYHLTIYHLGLVLGCMGLGVAISELIWGLLTDKYGDRKVLLFGLSSMGIVFALMAILLVPNKGYMPSYFQLGGAFILAGALGGSINSSSGRAVMTWFTDGERGFAMSIRQTAIPMGGALGAMLLPWLAKTYNFKFVFGAVSLSCFICTFIVWLWLYEKNITSDKKNISYSENKSPLFVKDVWRITLASALLAMPQMAILTFAAIFLHDYKHLDLSSISIILVIIQIGGAILRVSAGKFTDKFKNRRNVIKVIALLSGIFTIAIGLFTDNYTMMILIFLVGSGLLSNAWHGVAYTEIAVVAGAERAGTALGMIGTSVFISGFITPLVIPIFISSFSWNISWCIIGLATLLSIPLIPASIIRKPEIA